MVGALVKLRDYQEAAVRAVWDYYLGGGHGNALLALPTGTGKSLLQAALARSMISAYPHTRVLFLTHVKELIEQNYATLHKHWPGVNAGIYSAGLGRKETGLPIIFGGIASIKSRARAFSRTNLVFIDEAHLVSPSETTMYQQFLSELRQFNPALKVIGFTATPYRLGQGKLTDDGLFTDLIFDITSGDAFLWLIDQGYLAPLYPKATKSKIDLTGIGTQRGEFHAGQLDAAIRRQGIIEQAIDETLELAKDCSSWLIFNDSVDNAEATAAILTKRGIPAAAVHSKMSAVNRDERIAALRNGKLRALANVGILTTGFDHPGLDCIVLLRPTQSPGLHVQICGRGTRPVYADGFDLMLPEGRLAAIKAGPKAKGCLVLDFARNTERLGPINWPNIPRKKGEGGGMLPARECEACGTYNHISVRFCICCGAEMPRAEKLEGRASTAELIARRPAFIKIHPVSGMHALRYVKGDQPPMIRINYQSGGKSFSVFIGPEHNGWLRKRAVKWWEQHCPGQAIPTTSDAFLNYIAYCRVPRYIKVNHADKYPDVLEYDFVGHAFAMETNPNG